ncbi:MAG TPA: thaumarchaeosortase [Nitrosopumilaceae archaeon]|nr:thaumarchaeosortase [Nitrosopumilaceae archaeon]
MIAGILLISSPILFALIAFPDSFSLSWNQGRGGFLFALAFIVAELVGLKLKIPIKRLIAVIPLAVMTIVYLIGLEYGLREYIENGSEIYNVQLIFSWTWMWDFLVMTAFVVSTLFIFFGTKWIRISPAGPIFLGGSAIILSLDAFFPYDTLGPLQYIVPYLVQTNAWIITTFDLGMASARDNLLFLKGDHGAFALQVFWPSAGVHSVIIYSLVMMAFLLKMNIQKNRKIIYFAIGIFGTISVNMIRIFSLSLFALKVSTNAAEFEEYHSVAGEIMFLPWLFIFLLIVTAVETKRLKKLENAKVEEKSSKNNL